MPCWLLVIVCLWCEACPLIEGQTVRQTENNITAERPTRDIMVGIRPTHEGQNILLKFSVK